MALTLAAGSVHAACDFRPPLANNVALGVISPVQAGNVVASITLRYSCTVADQPGFSLSGVNDTGPGLHRMRNLTKTNAYLPYRVTIAIANGNRLTVDITVTEADYRDAWIGSYEDTLTLTVTP
jgi:hypothetical protein